MKKNKKILLSIITIIFIIIISYMCVINKKRRYDVSINLTPATNLTTVFNKLHINNSIFFKLFLKLEKHSGKNIKAGFYIFKGEYSFKNILNILEKGRDRYVVFTVPEGYTIKEIGELIEKKKIGTIKGLNEALKKIKEFPYLTPNGNFEGYLYPETYYLPINVDELFIVKEMLNQFLKRFPSENYPDKQLFYKQLILGSIIEREAQLKSEKPLMASVFYNRLNKNMRLGSDATVNYIYDYKKRRMLYKDLKIDSPYNTYKNNGLPPGPISNPDYDSIMAAIKPAKTDYLFFVVTTAGKHTFTKTYKEHLQVQKIEN